MCCCGKPTINGEMGYRWQPNDAPTIRQPHLPELREGDVLLYEEPGRCGGLDCHSHDFRVVKRSANYQLLCTSGLGLTTVRLFRLMIPALEPMESNARYWMLYALYTAHVDAAHDAMEMERRMWQAALAENRVKVNRRSKRGVRIEIEPAQNQAQLAL